MRGFTLHALALLPQCRSDERAPHIVWMAETQGRRGEKPFHIDVRPRACDGRHVSMVRSMTRFCDAPAFYATGDESCARRGHLVLGGGSWSFAVMLVLIPVPDGREGAAMQPRVFGAYLIVKERTRIPCVLDHPHSTR